MDLTEYFRESNAIENVYDEAAIEDMFEAWDYLQNQDELTHEVVKGAHERILQNRQPDIAGEYRTVNVRIGSDIPPRPAAVPGLMGELLERTPETGVEAIQWHVDFEKIHPFADGNGRIGRLLYLWHCQEVLDVPPVMWRADDVAGYYALFETEPAPGT